MPNHDHRIITIGVVAPHGSQTLDIVGPVDAFTQANQIANNRIRYAVTLLSTAPGPVVASSGLRLMPDRRVDETDEPFDTLLLAGSPDIDAAAHDSALAAWLAGRAPTTRRIASICNGAFILGAAGLLEDRRVTTHWRFAGALAARFPGARVEPDRIFVRDGNIYTSAGVAAGIDLALALIEQDCGVAISLAVARDLVVFLRRPGGQSQFSMQLQAQLAGHSQLGAVAEFILANLAADLSLGQLAQQAAMSERSLARLFQEELRITPARYVEAARIEAARSLLETGAHNLQQVARQCGFGSTDTLRRAFLRHVKVTPGDYRQRFRTHAE